MKKLHLKLNISLRSALVSTVVAAVVITGFGVGIPAYRDSLRATDLLWENLSEKISDLITAKTLAYFHAAPEFLQFTEDLMLAGEVDISDPFKTFTYCASALRAYPHFYWVYYANVNGDLLAAIRKSDQSIEAVFRKQTPHPEDATLTTFTHRYRFQDQQWVAEDAFWESYNPRARPYWAIGLEHPLGGWTEPYLFTDPPGVVGVSYVRPFYAQGKLQGMWIVDYFLETISKYLASLQMHDEGIIAIVTDEGTLVASSMTEPSSVPGVERLQNLVGDGRRIQLAKAWESLKKDHVESPQFRSKRFELGPYLGYIQSFSGETAIPWNVLTIVPKSFFFKPIVHQTWKAVSIAVSICVLCALGVIVFFRSLSRRLKKIAQDMDRIGEFELSDTLFDKTHSFIRELNLMNGALDRMKTCLRSFAKYVPLDLVSKLIRSGHPAELGGEKQQVTILFADLANFTSLAEIETSEELVDVLDQYLSEMGNLITAGKGTVDKYIGDGIMAFWGAPAKTTSHALDACRAALIMKQKSKALWKNFKNFHHGIELSLRIGINTGVAIVGNFGSSARMNYTAIGDPVNLANRLESLNKFYGTQILIGPDTAKAVEPFFLLRPIDHVAVKGRKQVVLVYELLSEGKEATANVLLALKTYAEGLEQYTHRQFREAIDSFKRVIQLLEGKDPPSEIMIRKAQHYLERPPGSDWNGTTVLDLITPEQ